MTSPRPFRLSPFWILLVGYLLITLLNHLFGYLHTFENRIKGNDPVYYYVYLHSLFFDGDLSFSNNLMQFASRLPIPELTVRGYHENYFSIGPAILWVPFFLLAHGVALLSPVLGLTWAADGWSYPYIAFIYVGNSFYTLLGLWFTYRFLATLVTPRAALYASLTLQWASQMTFYVWPDLIMSHSVSFAMAALCFWLWRTQKMGLVTGWAAAWMVLARWQNAILLLPLAVHSLMELISDARAGDLSGWFRRHLLFVVTFLAGVAPQMIVWQVIYGTPLTVPQGAGFLRFDDLHLWATLFDTNHGLFTWHPILLAGLVGLLLQGRRNPLLVLPVLAVLLLQWVLNAAVIDWWAGWSFGHRRFDSVLPLFALGLAMLYEHLGRQNWHGWLTRITVVLVVWNLLFIYQFKQALIPRDKVAPTWSQIILEKFRLWEVYDGGLNGLIALERLKGGNIDGFMHHSLIAYQKAPNLGVSLPLFSVYCMLRNNQLEGRVALDEWMAREKDLFLSRWVMAELLVRGGDYEGAARVVPLVATDSPQVREVAIRILNRAPTVLDDKFFSQFLSYAHNLFFYY